MRYIRALLVRLATGAGVVLSVFATAVAYREWDPLAPCLLVVEPNADTPACSTAAAPWWLLVAVGLAVGVGSGWSTARMSRRTAQLMGRGLLAVAFVVLAIAALRPISGSPIFGSDVSVSCGPAGTAWLGLSGPQVTSPTTVPAPRADVRAAVSGWCESEAGDWVRPIGAAGLALLLAAMLILAFGRLTSRTPTRAHHTPAAL